MEAHRRPPAGWDQRVPTPCQSSGFAQTMQTMGYDPIYFMTENKTALALIRGRLPLLGTLAARANVFTATSSPDFLSAVLMALGRHGIAGAKVGDTMWGIPACVLPSVWPYPRTEVVTRHTFVLDLTLEEDALFRRLDVSVRTSVRKAQREGLQVRPLESMADLDAYCRLSTETSSRVRNVSAYTDFPPAFFKALYTKMMTNGTARGYLAWHGDLLLAGSIFLCSPDAMLYFHGVSTRDRKWTALQAPTAVLWHAITEAKRLGMTRFDFGGCTPTQDSKDPRYGVYAFKKRWGGELASFYNLQVVLSRPRFLLQERVLAPLWSRLHPLYFKLISSSSAARAE